MKSLFIIINMLNIITNVSAQTLSGRVFDSNTKESLPGVAVFISDLKTGSVTDHKGYYEIKNLPKSKFVINVKLIGFTTISTTVDLSKTTQKDFMLLVATIESPEAVVTGSAFTSEPTRTSVPVVPIEKLQITTIGAGNIAKAIANTPGVSAISTGDAVGKPVIRGLSYNRIVIVNEGVRQEGQQWGDEHGIEIDEFSADRIEVLKGPSSLLYGSDALGGVINILEPIPPPNGKIRGELHSNFSTNNLLSANSLMLEGNQSGFVWRLRGTYKSAIPYKTPTEQIFNSGFNEKNAEGFIGLNRSWGYSHLHFSKWDSNIGFTEGDRDSLTGKILNADGHVPSYKQLKSRDIFLSYQNVSHDKLSLVNNIIIGESQLRVNVGWQQNNRKEFAESVSYPSLWFHLNTATWDAKYYFPQRDSLEIVVGTSGMTQQNQNKGTEFLIPNYRLTDFGGFASVKKTFAKTTLNAGVRYDIRYLTTDQLIIDSTSLFSRFSSEFSAFTGSVGATHEINKTWNIKANIGRGFRAPNISELSANGVHEGTFRYEAGNAELIPETSLQFDVGISGEWSKINVLLNGFYNTIHHFIYYRHSAGDTLFVNETGFPVYRYTQGNSTLKGFEFSFDIHPVSNLHFENSAAFVEGTNNDIGQPLPFIPSMKLENEIRYTFKTKKESQLKEPYVRVSLINTLKQDRIDAFETVTEANTLINAGIGTNIVMGHQSALVFINVNNLTDTKYFNHLSRLKALGIYEMGRNITFGIHIPFGLK